MKPLAPNTLLQNRYLIVHSIGQGGTGEVYLSVDQRLGSSVALKRILPAADVQSSDLFDREARILSGLRHPVLPKVGDHFIENDSRYLVMEHISGDDLAKRLKATQKPFPLSWVLFWADQLLEGLAYLHTHEPPIVHRDIKPQNLKLTDENNILLLDFELAKSLAGQPGGAGGTPPYAPMEQIRGTGTNPRSDIYSLSATLYQLLTNIIPPDSLSRADYLLSGRTDPITPINQINSEIPKAISDVVLKGMAISQDDRFTDAREMQKILRETYARMQVGTSDKTVAFNVEDEQPVPAVPASSFPQDRGEFSPPVRGHQTAPKEVTGGATIPFGVVGNTASESLVSAPNAVQNTDSSQDFDATIRINDVPNAAVPQNFASPTEVVPAADSAPPQSAIKTEVFGGDFGAAQYLQNNPVAPAQNFAPEDYAAEIEETPAPPQNFTGDRTVPLIQFDSQNAGVDLAHTQSVSLLDSVPQAESLQSTAETRLPIDDYSTSGQAFSQPEQEAPPPVRSHTPPVQPKREEKKSKGLIFAVIGGLFGFAILAVAAAGIAWYLMNQPDVPDTTNAATPTPAPSVSPTPTPEPTPEQANTNTNTGSNTNAVTTGNTDNSAVNAEPSPDKTKPVIQAQTPITQPTRNVSTRPTPITTQRTPKPLPTGKPEPTPKIRGTVIPQ